VDPARSTTSERICIFTYAVKSRARIESTSPMSAPFSFTFALAGKFSALAKAAVTV
jgi:hypothetical protein